MADADPHRPPQADVPPIEPPTSDSGETEAAAPRRRWPWPVKLLLGVLATILLAWAILYITKGRFLRGTFESIASKQLGREVKVAGDFQLYLDIINIKFVADELSIANPEWRGGQFMTARHVDTRIRTLRLLFGERKMKWLNLDGANFDLAWDAQRKRNTFTFGDPNAPPVEFELPDIARAAVTGTRISYIDPLLQLKTNIRVDTIAAKDTRFAGDIRFAGDGTMRGKPFTLSGSLMSPNETVSGGQNRLALHAEAANTVMDVSGTLPGATVINGADLKMQVRGYNFANLFDFLGVAIPDTRAYRFTSNLTKEGDEWRFTRLAGRFGDSDLAGRMTIALKQRLLITADLDTRVLDIIDVGPFIGYDPERLDKTGTAVRTVNGRPKVLPDAPLRVDALKVFDARVNYRVARVRAESFPISNIGLTLDLQQSLLRLAPLTFDMAGGRVSASIDINARGTPVRTRYDIAMSPTPMGRLLGRWGVEESGTSGTISARVNMTGEGDTVAKSLATSDGRIAIVMPQGTFWTRNIQLAELDVGTYVTKLLGDKLKKPVQLNCGLIAFTVRDGVAAADPILIDTRKNVILGRGGFSFKTEGMDLRIRADGKTFSLFSGQSPVGVGGYFAQPKLDVISPQLIARGGAGLGLAIAASPFAAVLAFVDPGDAKAAACGPVLAGANASAMRTKGGKPRDDVGKGTTAKSESGKAKPEEAKKQRKKFLGIF